MQPKDLLKTDYYSPAVPADAIRIFKMFWQLENWLRIMAYVELRANRLDWEEKIDRAFNASCRDSDKNLPHMNTSHQAKLSYITFGELWKVILGDFKLFEQYLFKRDNLDSRIKEIKTIRNRVAHFRTPHANDESRMELFMRDVDPGIHEFCSRYTTPKVPRDSGELLLVKMLRDQWACFGHAIELRMPSEWLYAEKESRQNPQIGAGLDFLMGDEFTLESGQGVILKLTVSSLKRDTMNFVDVFNNTKHFHDSIIHFWPASHGTFSVTIPAVIGVDRSYSIIESFLSAGLNAAGGISPTSMEHCKQKWPEYVLWPDHLLSYFDGDIKEPILDLS